MGKERNNLLTILVLWAGLALFVSAQISEAERQRLLSAFTVVNGKVVRKSDVTPNATQPEAPNPPQPETPNATLPEVPFANAARNDTEPASVNASSLVGVFATNNPLSNNAEGGLLVTVSQQEIDELVARISDTETTKAIASGQRSGLNIGQSATKVFSNSNTNETQDNGGFGPHLITSPSAATIGRTAGKFLAATEQLITDLKLTADEAKILKAVPLPNINSALDCPYDDPIICQPSSKYRTFDGSCNNLANPFFGKANTPFERFLPAKYEDGFGGMRRTGAGSGLPLPNPRLISTRYHQASSPINRQFGVSALTMTYGQFVSHDVNMNTISRGSGGQFLQCCNNDGSVTRDPQKIALGCAPIEIPFNDPFYAQFGRTCMSFIRAVGGTDINCRLGVREQINQVTHFLDGSGVYGSNVNTANNLRAFVNGLLRSDIGPDNRELLMQNPSSAGSFSCRSAAGSNHHCFHAGDVRVNQNNPLITIHTLFLREHNRLARELNKLNPSWNDEKLFQEARRINVAQYQHITYNEYLPVLLSKPVAQFFRVLAEQSGYFNGYSETVNPAIRNSFVAAAYRSGHSTIDDKMARGFDLTSHLNNPTGVYSPGIDYFVESITRNPSQRMDRLDAAAITNRLFEGTRPGSGMDLVATNIQRGRDHGLPSYNDLREFCTLPRAKFFGTGPGGLEHHSSDSVFRLAGVYRHVDDIDAWTGMSSELPLNGGVFGATAACLVAIQFNFLRRGDRFYYENNDVNSKFELAQLDSIRSASLSALFCANTGYTELARSSFLNPSFQNPVVPCGNLPLVDLNLWRENTCKNGGWGPWGQWTPCSSSRLSFKFRFCNNPHKDPCGKDCVGDSYVYRYCQFVGVNFGSAGKSDAPQPATVSPNPSLSPLHIQRAAQIAMRQPRVK